MNWGWAGQADDYFSPYEDWVVGDRTYQYNKRIYTGFSH